MVVNVLFWGRFKVKGAIKFQSIYFVWSLKGSFDSSGERVNEGVLQKLMSYVLSDVNRTVYVSPLIFEIVSGEER